MALKIRTKKMLRMELGGVARQTLQNWIEILTTEKDCPFTIEEWKQCGQRIKQTWYNFIVENI